MKYLKNINIGCDTILFKEGNGEDYENDTREEMIEALVKHFGL